MPVIQVTLIEGYDEGARQRLCERLTDAARAVIDAPAEAVTVAIAEVTPAGYMRGRERKKPGRALPAAAEVALDFLDRQGRRDLVGARSICAEGFEMVFPGAARFFEFEELIEWAKPRYRAVAKTIERVEEAAMGDYVAVWVTGTLHGEHLDGSAFEGIRFVDRFEVRGGLIARQEVWNDMAESLGPV